MSKQQSNQEIEHHQPYKKPLHSPFQVITYVPEGKQYPDF